MTNLHDVNFDEFLNCSENHRIIVGYTNTCDTCKRLTCMLQMKHIQYARIDMTRNKLFLENLKRKRNSVHVSLPAILIYKDKEFKKMINPTIDTNEIIRERDEY